jgi:hypothetical protein
MTGNFYKNTKALFKELSFFVIRTGIERLQQLTNNKFSGTGESSFTSTSTIISRQRLRKNQLSSTVKRGIAI